jgi:hypothetical protein
LCRRPPFGPDFYQQFGAHLVEESKTTWRGPVRQAPKPPRLRRRSLRSHRNPPTRWLRPSSLRRGPVLGQALLRSSTPPRGCSRSASRGWGASAQDIEALRRIRALIAGKSIAVQHEQGTRPFSSQAQPSQQQDVVPPHTAPDSIDFNIRQAERYLALLQSQIAGTTPPQQVAPAPPAPTPTPATHAAPAAQQHA